MVQEVNVRPTSMLAMPGSGFCRQAAAVDADTVDVRLAMSTDSPSSISWWEAPANTTVKKTHVNGLYLEAHVNLETDSENKESLANAHVRLQRIFT